MSQGRISKYRSVTHNGKYKRGPMQDFNIQSTEKEGSGENCCSLISKNSHKSNTMLPHSNSYDKNDLVNPK